ncbi:MAG TPA: hypothetical protein VM571_06715 [Noviherbaspirillum sp.]|jgi:hypothetical protein|nr:hypothetical protein [Noviherbaspirillum sp.]
MQQHLLASEPQILLWTDAAHAGANAGGRNESEVARWHHQVQEKVLIGAWLSATEHPRYLGQGLGL